MKTKLISFALISYLLLIAASQAEAACKIYITDTRSTADHMVYFTTTRSNQRNEKLVKGCKFTSTRSTATVKVYITKTRSNADIIVLRENFGQR